ncbi:hypothetical protein SGGMMB4_00927 [Sodalis glossinidius str. 'morsitans']|uniref:Uncharacterized protein n=1 Tax=Sodalis glossinidius (strain morsitans) TaxID=343509 RepID=A0A193QFU3_SODGM|nr:hypothetical protein SGGMMB4_00927 [Sodalis glossinidius str. 'morsitans']
MNRILFLNTIVVDHDNHAVSRIVKQGNAQRDVVIVAVRLLLRSRRGKNNVGLVIV